MKQLWPYGRGCHAQARMHILFAAVVAFGSLFTISLGAMGAMDNDISIARRLAVAARMWTPVVFAMVSLTLSAMRLFRPGLLRLMLPAPLETTDIYNALGRRADATVLRMLGAITIALAQFPESGPIHAAVAFVYTYMLLAMLFAVSELLAVLFRKILLPLGHYLLWAVVAVATWGGFAGWRIPGMDSLLLTHVRPSWLLLIAAAALALVSELVSGLCRRAAHRHYVRDELLDYAFPLEAQVRSAPRRMVVEAFRGNDLVRRFIFLIQQATGLHRLRDWAKAACVWLAAFVGLLLLLRETGGSAAHIGVTLLSLIAVSMWCALRHARLTNEGQQMLKPLTLYALPVGKMEMSLAITFALSVVYFLTGILAGPCVELVSALCASENYVALPAEKITLAVITNLAQVWLILMSCRFGRWSIARIARKARRVGIGLGVLHMSLCAFLLFAVLTGVFVPALILEKTAWWRIAPAGAKIFTALVCSIATGGRGETMFDFLKELPPLWQFKVITWATPSLLAALGLIGFRRESRGKVDGKRYERSIAGKPDSRLLGPEFRKVART